MSFNGLFLSQTAGALLVAALLAGCTASTSTGTETPATVAVPLDPAQPNAAGAQENTSTVVQTKPAERPVTPIKPAPGPAGTPKGSPSDMDSDGILDSSDRCPDVPEDRDGFQDADGCPDMDNDMDGIADANDQCPNEPETKNGFQDLDGCPETGP